MNNSAVSNISKKEKDVHFFIHNSFGSGDVILTRPLIREIQSAFPCVKITLECMENKKYLWGDLNLPIEIYEGAPHGAFATPTPNCPKDAFFINAWFAVVPQIFGFWGLSYATTIHTFNEYMNCYKLDHMFQLPVKRKIPFIEFYEKKQLPFTVREHSVFVENGHVNSNQSFIKINDHLQEFANSFPDLNFYCSATPNFKADNVIDCSRLNLIELSEVSNHCFALLTRASGVNAATLTETNRYKPRCIAGWIFIVHLIEGTRVPESLYSPWDTPQNLFINAITKENIQEFLSFISGRKEYIKKYISMAENPDFDPVPPFEPLALKNSGNRFCKILHSREDVEICTNYLKETLLASHSVICKDWEIAHIITDLSDGNLLDMGSTDSYILKNALLKGINGEKYGIDLRNPDVPLPTVKYLVGDLLNVPLPDNYFQNITCLSVLEHEVDIKRFAGEASRLLKNGGKLYVTFDYWEPKIDTGNITLYGLSWNIFSKDEVLNIIDECKKQGLYLVEDMDFGLGEAVVNENYYSPAKVSYTFGMLVFRKG